MVIRRLVLITLAMLWAAVLCLAQLDTATILGTVFDPSGAVVPGAKVVVQNMGTSATKELTTDQTGLFIAPLLPVGKYKVTVSLTGFTTYVQEGVQVSVADRVQLSITLKPGAVTQEVTVVGQTPLVETASTTIGAVIGTQQIVDLPLNGRAIDQLVMLAPGVVAGTYNGASSGRLWENGQKWLLDGGDTSQIDSDLAAGGYGSTARVNRVSVDAVAEFRLVNSSYSAEYGHSVGAVINFISKSGTNEYHGSIFEFFRNEVLDARNAFNPAPLYKPPRRLNQFGGTLGGPIVKDKLFFFTNYEGVRQRTGVFGTILVPTEAFRSSLSSVLQPAVAMLPLPNGSVSSVDSRLAYYSGSRTNELTENSWMARLDYQQSSKDRWSFRYNRNGALNKTYFGFAEGQFRRVPSRLQTSKISYTRTITPTMLNEVGFFINRGHWYTPASGVDSVRRFPIVATLGSGAAGVGPSVWDMDVANTLFTYADTLSLIKGKHQIKIGTEIARMQCNKEVNFQQYLYFPTLDWFAYNMSYLYITVGWPRPGLRITQQGYYVQDDIQATKNLTVNAGLRYQYDGSPTEAFGRIANFDLRTGKLDAPGSSVYDAPKLNFAPRIGLAYTPFGSKKTVIRAGWGIFFANYNAADAQFLPTNVPGFSQMRSFTIFEHPELTAFPFPDISGYTSAFSPTAFNKDWQAAYTEQWSLNVQRGLGESMVFEVGYVGNWGRHYSPIQEGNPLYSGTTTRRYAGVSGMTYYGAGASTKFNSLQVSLKRRMSHGLAFNIFYTWSHNLDQGGMSFGPGAQNPDNYEAEWASADYDVRHNVTFNYTYQFPAAPGIPKWLGSGWQINGITVIRGGLPINVVANTDPMMIGQTTSRPHLVAGQSMVPALASYGVPGDDTHKQLNIAAFKDPYSSAGPAPFGTMGRNLLSGSAASNWDFSLFKRFRVREGQELEFRFELFNTLNHPNFSNPSANITAPATFGRSWAASTAREMQFALKYYF